MQFPPRYTRDFLVDHENDALACQRYTMRGKFVLCLFYAFIQCSQHGYTEQPPEGEMTYIYEIQRDAVFSCVNV